MGGTADALNVEIIQADIDQVLALPEVRWRVERTALLRVIQRLHDDIAALRLEIAKTRNP